MEKTFAEKGHEFCLNPADADVIFYDLWNVGGRYIKRDVEQILFWQKPVVGFDFKDQWGSPEHRPNWWGWDDFAPLREKSSQDHAWATHLLQFLEAGIIRIMFMRKMCQSWVYPSWVAPIECAIWPEHDFDPCTKDALCKRTHDVCFIGNATPWRANAACDLAAGGINGDFFFQLHRIEHEKWLGRHAHAKMFLEADGGGFGSERPYQLATLAPMLKIKNDQKMAHPWKNGENCIEIGGTWGNVMPYECRELKRSLMDLDWLHQIYLNGVQHLHDHYSTEARANYVLQQMKGAGLE